MNKKKRNRSARAQVSSPENIKVVPWYKKAWPWITGVAVVTGWVLMNGNSAISNLEKLPSSVAHLYGEVSTWYHTNQSWTGKWTNEGEVDTRYQPDIYVHMDLLVRDQTAEGTISSGPQQDSIPFKFVLLKGVVTNDGLDLAAYDYFQGIPKRIATFQVSHAQVKEPGRIKVVTTWQALPWFPKETVLWRIGNTVLTGEN